MEDISKSTPLTDDEIDLMSGVLVDVVRELLTGGDSIAMPAFGTFIPQKSNETISVDPATGATMLIPPRIDIAFIPALKLTKLVKQNQ